MDFVDFEVTIFKALAHPIRLALLKQLGENELCVCELNVSDTGSQSNVSQHLKILKDANLVKQRREGAKVYYQITDTRVLDMIGLSDQMIVSSFRAMELMMND